jgi:3,4-dihydroxy 2-butanone 4-phosphate synthase/GTP cyclohydrolase II
MKRGPQVEAFAREHGLKTVSVADLIAWRQRRDRLVERIEDHMIKTPFGPARAISYRTPFDPMHHLAIVWGDIRDGRDIPVRLHLESVVDDVIGAARPLDRLMRRLSESGRGVLVYLREGSVGVARAAHRPREELAPNDEAHGSAQRREDEWREIGLGAQILKDLGVSSIRLLSSRERHYVGLQGFGIEIAKTEILDG